MNLKEKTNVVLQNLLKFLQEKPIWTGVIGIGLLLMAITGKLLGALKMLSLVGIIYLMYQLVNKRKIL